MFLLYSLRSIFSTFKCMPVQRKKLFFIIKYSSCKKSHFTQKIRSFFLLKYSSCKSLNFLQELYLSTSFYLIFYNVTISPSSSQRSCQSFAPCHKNTCPFTRRFPFRVLRSSPSLLLSADLLSLLLSCLHNCEVKTGLRSRLSVLPISVQ